MTRAEQLRQRRALVAAAAKRRPRRIPPGEPPRGVTVDYTRELVALSRELDAIILGALEDAGVVRTDEDGPTRDTRERLLEKIQRLLGRAISRPKLVGAIDRVAKRGAAHSEAQFRAQMRAAVGIDVASDPKLGPLVERFREHNVRLIRSLADEKVQRVREVLQEARGGRVESIAKRIAEEAGVTESRAALIARDQVLKLHADATRARHEAAGISKFEWSTSRDERVRPSHRALDGQVFAYSDPPLVDGERTLPGRAVQCRCVAVPHFDLEDDAAD